MPFQQNPTTAQKIIGSGLNFQHKCPMLRPDPSVSPWVERSGTHVSLMPLFCASLRFIGNDCKLTRFSIIWSSRDIGIETLDEKACLNKFPLKVLRCKIL